MRTRNSENPKPAASQKKTPTAKKCAAPKSHKQFTTPTPETTTPKSSASKRNLAAKSTHAKTPDMEPASSGSKTKTPVEETILFAEDNEVTPTCKDAQPASTTQRITRSVVRKKVVRKTPTPGKAASSQTSNMCELEKVTTDELLQEKTTSVKNLETSTEAASLQTLILSEPDKDKTDELLEETSTYVKNTESPAKDEVDAKGDVESPEHKEELAETVAQIVEDIVMIQEKGKAKVCEELPIMDPADSNKVPDSITTYVQSPAKDEVDAKGDVESPEHKELAEPVAQIVEDIVMIQEKGKAKVCEELPIMDPADSNRVPDSITTYVQSKESEHSTLLEMNEAQQKEEEKKNVDHAGEEMMEYRETENQDNDEKDDEDHAGEEMVEYGEDEAFIDPSEDDFREDDGLENVDQVKTSGEENMEHIELTAALKERKIRRELEVFVGGLDRDVVEDDVKKTFEKVGEVGEVRLLKDPSTNRNRGFAFVRFANKEQASRALSEMRNPVIRGKRCGTAPSEDNDVLFLGNICNTWTKEAIKQKLKDYAIEGVESITLVQDPRHEGLSRGFCFVQFACHVDAMVAYKRLQKPDAIFGHAERSVKVAFAEPLREPDAEVMAKVKSVFIDGLPAHWDEDHVRENFKCYGDIERITLARNMPSAKRKDFGFVDFSTHEAAIACIEDVNKRELGDGNSKARVRARLSNPMPKTQAVKGGMCGGFRIGRGGVVGRGFGRGNRLFDRANYQYDRPGFYQHVRGQFIDPMRQYPDFPEFHDRRQFGFGGRRPPSRGPHLVPSGSGNMLNNFNQFNGPRQRFTDRGSGRPPAPVREPLLPEVEGHARSFMGRHMGDPYAYRERAPDMKRPFYMVDQDPGYMEPTRVRPRFDFAVPGRGNQYRDTYGAGSSMYSSGYYGPGPDYGAGQYPPFRGNDRSYRGGGYY